MKTYEVWLSSEENFLIYNATTIIHEDFLTKNENDGYELFDEPNNVTYPNLFYDIALLKSDRPIEIVSIKKYYIFVILYRF